MYNYLNNINNVEINEDNKINVVMYHAKWCNLCQKILPEFNKASKKCNDKLIKWKKIECSDTKSTIDCKNVEEFPYFEIRYKNKEIDNFQNFYKKKYKRESNNFIKYVKKVKKYLIIN